MDDGLLGILSAAVVLLGGALLASRASGPRSVSFREAARAARVARRKPPVGLIRMSPWTITRTLSEDLRQADEYLASAQFVLASRAPRQAALYADLTNADRCLVDAAYKLRALGLGEIDRPHATLSLEWVMAHPLTDHLSRSNIRDLSPYIAEIRRTLERISRHLGTPGLGRVRPAATTPSRVSARPS